MSKKVKTGQTVVVHYVGTYEDGTEFDNSRRRRTPMSFKVGSGQLIKGFDSALLGMVPGETKKIFLKIEEAYGEINSTAYQSIPRTTFPDGFEFKVGEIVQGNGPKGLMRATIYSLEEENVTLNFNHPLAGKNLNFEIQLIEVQKEKNDQKDK